MSSTEKEEPSGSPLGGILDLEQEWEHFRKCQPTKERQHIGGNGIHGSMAAHRFLPVVGAGKKIGIGGSLNAGDSQLQQHIPEDDESAAALLRAPSQQGDIQQALGDEIDDADE